MDERKDIELLRRYCERGDELAFAEVVRRHVALVYSVALRVIVDTHLAEDATQATFSVLAKEARRLASHPFLTSWLHRTAFNQASKLVRGEMRRREREQEAFRMQSAEFNGESSDWDNVAPCIDSALDRLNESDRRIILLRFFERRKAREISDVLKLSEAAVHKRLSRALTRLRRMVAAEGVSLTAFGSILEAGSVVSVPGGLSGSVTVAALAGGVAGKGLGVTTLSMLVMSKLKISAVTAILLAGLATQIFWQHESLKRLREENAQLKDRAQQVENQRVESEASARQRVAKREQDSLSKAQMAELLRLRGEVGLLRKDSQELARLRSPSVARASAPEPREYLPATAWANVGLDKPEAAVQTFFWAGRQRDTNVLGNLLRWQRDPAIPASDKLDETFTASLISGSAQFASELEGFRITTVDSEGDEMRLGLEVTNDTGNTEAHQLRLVKEEEQWFPVMHVWLDKPGSVHASLDIPRKFRSSN